MMSVLPNGGKFLLIVQYLPLLLHSMMSVLPNGGLKQPSNVVTSGVALDDVSATEWRLQYRLALAYRVRLHSMMSVLPNGGCCPRRARRASASGCTR